MAPRETYGFERYERRQRMPLPRVTMDGRLTADPELRFTPGGFAVANFTVAGNDRKKKA
jgi:single-stranded DNA-binding protein